MYCTGEAKGRDAPSVALLRIIISLASSERCSDGWDARGKKKGMRQRASCLATPANDARFSILPRSPHHSRALLPIEEKKKALRPRRLPRSPGVGPLDCFTIRRRRRAVSASRTQLRWAFAPTTSLPLRRRASSPSRSGFSPSLPCCLRAPSRSVDPPAAGDEATACSVQVRRKQ